MSDPLLEGRISPSDMARFQAFSRGWQALHGGTPGDAFRAFVRLGLDAASRPHLEDPRWCEFHDRLQEIERLVDTLGRAVSANPALAAWLISQAPMTADAPTPQAIGDAIEEPLHDIVDAVRAKLDSLLARPPRDMRKTLIDWAKRHSVALG